MYKKKIAPRAAAPETKSNENITKNSIPDSTEKIKIVVQKPGCISEIAVIPNTLEAMQQLVQGYIETVTLNNGLILVMDEEGRLKGQPDNICCVQFGTVVGTVFITAAKGEDFVSLTTEQTQTARAWLLKHSVWEDENEAKKRKRGE